MPAIDARAIPCVILAVFMIPVQEGAAGAVIDLTAVLLLFPLLIGAASQFDPQGPAHRLCGFLGDISYPLYAIHYPLVRAICFVTNKHALPAPDRIAVGVATFVALTGISWLVFRFYDRPARRYLTGCLPEPASGEATPETLFIRTARSAGPIRVRTMLNGWMMGKLRNDRP